MPAKTALTFLLGAVLCLSSPSLSIAQPFGTVDISQSVQSEILDREMPYSIYLPESYHTSTREYPVLYLLHGMTDDHKGWINWGEMHRIAGDLMVSGEVPEMIIVMPEGLYDAFYINNYDESIRWEDFFHEEFMPHIEETYRITAQRSRRAISGLSMGGYGAMYHGVKYKEKFGVVAAMSGAFLKVEPAPEEERSEWDREFHGKTWGPYNDENLPENYKEHSLHEMFSSMEPIERGPQQWSPAGNREIPLPAILIDCGDDDFLLEQNTSLVHIMNSKNVDFEFLVRDGAHTWPYWQSGLELALQFIADEFRN